MRVERVRWREMTCALQIPLSHACRRCLYATQGNVSEKCACDTECVYKVLELKWWTCSEVSSLQSLGRFRATEAERYPRSMFADECLWCIADSLFKSIWIKSYEPQSSSLDI